MLMTVIIPQRKRTFTIPECKRPQERLPKQIRQAIWKERERIKGCHYTLPELRAKEKNAHNTYICADAENYSNTTYWLIMREAFGQEADFIENSGTATNTKPNVYEQSKQRALKMCIERDMHQQFQTESEE